jgi:hypothetical protein
MVLIFGICFLFDPKTENLVFIVLLRLLMLYFAVTNVTSPKTFLMESGRKKIWVWRGVFYGFGLWEMEISEHSITFSWVRFAGKMPASNILYNLLWFQEDERRSMIVNLVEKIWMQHGLNL